MDNIKSRLNPEFKDYYEIAQHRPIKLDSSFNYESLKVMRAWIKEMWQESVYENVNMFDKIITGPDEGQALRVKVYEPNERSEVLPGVLLIHGGGFIMGSADDDDDLCQRFVSEVNCVVVSVDYRLAPENPFPAPIEDCYTALKWFSENADELKVDAYNIAVVGGSAGGGLAAAVSLMARDRKGPSIAFQMLLQPMLDDRNITPSSQEINDETFWSSVVIKKAWSMYLGSNNKGKVVPYAAAARAIDLSGLPPTYTCVGDLDPFRDEVIEYATRLTRGGVPTELHLYPGCFHSFDEVVPNAEISKYAVNEYITALKRGLQKKRSGSQ